LEGLPNQEKSGKAFKQWLSETYPNEQERKEYMSKHYIPDIDLDAGNFLEFFEKREELIRQQLKKLLLSPQN
jgi:hypothetical protein